jgi:uncharacterized protein
MDHWKNKVVAVTGGSEGLGREIALTFARYGASVIVLGRDQTKLTALEMLAAEQNPGLSIFGISTDLTDESSSRAVMETIVGRWGQIDVWVNNLGRSTRIALTDAGIDPYRELMEINFFSAVKCTLAVLPFLQQSGGHLVNIGSLASRTGWPLIAPYATSKHALSAFHHQLRLEGPKNVHYLEVCTGPLQRTDAGVRYLDKSNKLGKSAAAPGAGVKIKGISPVWLAERIERACRQRKTEIIVPFYARFLFAFSQFFPSLGDRVLLATRKKE